jgi:Fungal ATP synthase protein 8 (A6L)
LFFTYSLFYSYGINFIYILIMPQLVPFFFTHQILLVFSALTLLLMIFSKYILPNILSIHLGKFTLSNKVN